LALDLVRKNELCECWNVVMIKAFWSSRT
jgi:hypothetical protein